MPFIICIMANHATGTPRALCDLELVKMSEYKLQLISCEETDCCNWNGELMQLPKKDWEAVT